jgi:ketosteroid isomerase-like protein
MSPENVDVLRKAVTAINARDLSDATIGTFLTPDCRWENISTAVTDKTYEGANGLREWVSDTFDGLAEDTRYELTEVVAEGDDFAVIRVRLVGHGARSEVPLDLRWVGATWFRDGKVARTAGFARRREALKAVGLED